MNKREIKGFIAQHAGIVVDEDDPIFAVVAVQIKIQQDYEARLQKIEADLKRENPSAILKDLLRQHESQIQAIFTSGVNWTSDPQTRWTWIFGSLFCAMLLFGLGFILGAMR